MTWYYHDADSLIETAAVWGMQCKGHITSSYSDLDILSVGYYVAREQGIWAVS